MDEETDENEFNIGKTFYCYFRDLLYKVKCLNRRISDDDEPEYLIHYIGWKNRWDEWVTSDRLLLINETNDMHKYLLECKQKDKKRSYVRAIDKAKTKSETSLPPNTSEEIMNTNKHDKDVLESNQKEKKRSDVKAIDKAKTKSETSLPPKTSEEIMNTNKHDKDVLESNQKEKKRSYVRAMDKDKTMSETSLPPKILKKITNTNEHDKNVLESNQKEKKRSYARVNDKSVLKKPETNKAPTTSKKRVRSPAILKVKFAKYTPISEVASSSEHSNINAVETCVPVPSTSTETPGPSLENSSSVSEIQFTDINADKNSLQINVTEKPSNTIESETDNSSSQVNINENAENPISSIQIAKKIVLSFSKDIYNTTTLKRIEIPTLISNEIDDDYLIVNFSHKILKFPEVFTVADIINDYIQYQKSLNIVAGENAIEFGASLLNLFNGIVNKQLLYYDEVKYKIQNKGLCNFIEKSKTGNLKECVLKELLIRKKVWCYVYGPVHLLRLFVFFSRDLISYCNNQLVAISAGSQCFLEFVEANVKKYFAERKYICKDEQLI